MERSSQWLTLFQSSIPINFVFPSASRKEFERIAALLGLDDWMMAIGFSGRLALRFAEQHVKGKTEIAHVTPELEKLLTSNSEFFEALCEEGVLEWLTPLVLTKSTTSSHD